MDLRLTNVQVLLLQRIYWQVRHYLAVQCFRNATLITISEGAIKARRLSTAHRCLAA